MGILPMRSRAVPALSLLFLCCCCSDSDTGKMPVEHMGGTPMPHTGETPMPHTGKTPVPRVSVPLSESIRGGFHSTKYFRPRGEPSLSISVISRPVRRPASSTGFAIVAEQQIICGIDP